MRLNFILTIEQSLVFKRSRNSELHSYYHGVTFVKVCLESHIILDVKWVPRVFNNQADSISLIRDYDDYTINEFVFTEFDQLWGPYTVDRVACTYNAKLPRFNSRFYQIGTEGVDAFTQNWGFNNNWLFPPTVLIPRVIRHLCECSADESLLQ
jgi:hypothetical protein